MDRQKFHISGRCVLALWSSGFFTRHWRRGALQPTLTDNWRESSSGGCIRHVHFILQHVLDCDSAADCEQAIGGVGSLSRLLCGGVHSDWDHRDKPGDQEIRPSVDHSADFRRLYTGLCGCHASLHLLALEWKHALDIWRSVLIIPC